MNTVIAVIYGIILIVLAIILVVYKKQVNEYKNMYEKTLEKFNGESSIKDKFTELFDKLRDVEDICKDTQNKYQECKNVVADSISKVAVVKYNALDDTDNNLSFALAQMNAKNDGIVINHVYSKYGSSLYIKQVNGGTISDRASQEEAEAVETAMKNEENSMREEVQTNKLAKVKVKSRK